MRANPTPQQILAGLLQGIPPPRPLWLPIVFSLGARMENLPLGAFLKNATKISNSLKQICGHVRSDGVSCYFDPYLEAEALGGVLEWNTETQRPALGWPGHAHRGELPGDLHSTEEAMKRGRVGVALEVIRRLKSLLRDDSLLTAGVTGPFTLAARLTQSEPEPSLEFEHLSEAALEVAGSMMTKLSAAFAEAGANLIFIQEDVVPRLTAERCEEWASRLEPAFNIVRFYQALPVLLLTNTISLAESMDVIFQQHWDCVVCETLDLSFTRVAQAGDTLRGVALPPAVFQPENDDKDLDRMLTGVMSGSRPAIVTTAGEIPAGADMKRVIRISESVRSFETEHGPGRL